ncbi:MAG: PfkB family carbohydrate kinase [Clostridia bacterium]|nr:PfkB family carbohydrate kinase [Clostridia bacterium]
MFDVVALGELLIDFTPMGLSQAGNELFERNPGGAPANVLAAVRKLGKTSAFIGMVGKDQFGVFLKAVLENSGIDATGLKFAEEVNTTLAFVHLNSKGDRSFSFYRNPGADMMLSEKDIDFDLIKGSRVFHFGSISLTHEPARSATLAAVKYAKDHGVIVSYDPNLRPPLWKNLEDAREKILMGLKYADILKISEEELEFITGSKDLEEGSLILYNMGVKVVLITLGPKGCFYRYSGGTGRLNTYDTKVVDTTGAGDGFFGGVLFKLCEMNLEAIGKLSKDEFEMIIDFGNAVGALATTRKGAIPAMPTLDEVRNCQSTVRLLQI